MERPNFQPWHELTILSVIGMEIAWVSLWFRIFSRTGGVISYWRALAVLGGMLAGAYALAHLLNVLRLRINLRRGLLAILLISGVFLGSKTLLYPGQAVGAGEILRRTVLIFDLPSGVIPSEFAVALALIWAWGRGVYLAGREVDASLVRRSFYTGAGMLFAYGLIAPATGETLVAPLYLFLFFWLSAMSAARIYGLARFGHGQSAAFDRKWLAGILSAVLGVVGVAALAAELMDWKIASLVAFTLGWLVRVVLLAAALLMSPLVLLLALLMPLLQKLLKDFPQGLRSVGEAMQQLGNMVEQLRQPTPDQPFSLPPFIRPALLWGILGLAAVYVVWMLQKRSLQSSPEREEDPEMILRGGELLRHLLSALRSSAQSLAGQMGELGLGGARRMLAAARIRRIYARLMELSADLGKPRPAAFTPLEYLPTLENLFPNHSTELEQITAAYLQVRYGELAESRQEIEVVEAAWKRLSEQGRVMQDYNRMKKDPG